MANDVMSYCYSLLVLAGSAIGAFDLSSGRNSWWMMAAGGGSSGGSVNKPDPSDLPGKVGMQGFLLVLVMVASRKGISAFLAAGSGIL